MRKRNVLLSWILIWVLCAFFGVMLSLIYARLPVDGSTGDLSSFNARGFRVQWLLEHRDGGLLPGDIIVSVQGYTVGDWLDVSTPAYEPNSDDTATYLVIRNDEPLELRLILRPASLLSVASRWIPQLVVAALFLVIGGFVFIKRPAERPAQLLMTFCVLLTLQYWGDAYNMQYAALLWRWPFWIQLFTEHVIYSLGISTITYFALTFPISSPIVARYRQLIPCCLYIFPILAVGVAMAVSGDWTSALASGNRVSWIAAIIVVGIAISAGAYSIRNARDPISRAQVKWIIWCAALGGIVTVPFYALPLAFNADPLIPHPFLMIFIAIIPVTLAICILRFRLFDITVIINRTLVYGTLTVLLAGSYLALVWFFNFVLQNLSEQQYNSQVIFVSAAAAALAFAPLRKRVQVIIDRIFYKSKLDCQRILNEMSEMLTTRIVLEDVSHLLTFELPKQLQISCADLAVMSGGQAGFVLVNRRNRPFLSEDDSIAYELQNRKYLIRLQAPPDTTAAAMAFLHTNAIELCIPLIAGDKSVGFYVLGGKLSGDAYNHDEIQLLRLLGKQAAVAVENSRLFRAESDQRKLAQALVEASRALGSTLDTDELLDRILVQVERVVAGDAVSIILADGEKATVVRLRNSGGMAGSFLGDNYTVNIYDDPILTDLAEKTAPIYIENLAGDDRWRPGPDWGHFGSVVAAPMLIDGAFSGALMVFTSEGHRLSREVSQNLSALANHAATAISNARLWEQAQREIVARMKTEEKITASLEEKNVLLQEIHHRVKNNLQVISSLLSLQSNQVENEEVAGILRDSRNRVRSIALVHETLYSSKNLARIETGNYIRSLVQYAIESFGDRAKRVSFRYAIEDQSIGINQAIPCGLILNELVTNSIKHAFPGDASGEIFIELSRLEDSRIRLVVGDTGVGMPETQQTQASDSLGLQIVRTLVKQLNGSAKIETSGGVVFSILFEPDD